MSAGRRRSGTNEQISKTHNLRGTQGDYTNKRPLGYGKDAVKNPQRLLASMIEAPEWMGEKEKEIFNQIRDVALVSDTAAMSDLIALNLMCMLNVQYEQVSEVIKEEGMVVTTFVKDNEVSKPHPLLSERSRTFVALRGLLTEFGMTPNSRRSVIKRDPDSPDTSEDETWDDLLN